MKTYSGRKFVKTMVIAAIITAGVTFLSDIAKSQDNSKKLNDIIPSFSDTAKVQNTQPPDLSTMRPIRKKQGITITVGQKEGDLRGNDDKVLQAAVDYVANLGGGTVQILPGVYTMRNSLFPRAGITIRGSGDKTILRKCPSVSSKIIREADWFEYCVQIEDPKGFTVGGGVTLSADKRNKNEVFLFTVTAIRGNVLFLDKLTGKNFWMMEGARASTRFSIIHGLNVDDVHIEELVLDGNSSENEQIDDNYAAALFTQHCNRWNFNHVTARDFNGNGFSFQVCDDFHFEDCFALNNTELGFHPGSGAQRPVLRRCTAKGNSQGFFWCWGVCDGIVEDCISSGNLKYGVNIGHRDTENIFRNCVIENNGEIGILFHKEVNEYRTGDRNHIENCMIRNNGKSDSGLGIDIQWNTNDITVRNCRFENANDGPQKTGIRISPEAQRITLENNKFTGCKVDVEDQRKTK